MSDIEARLDRIESLLLRLLDSLADEEEEPQYDLDGNQLPTIEQEGETL